GKLSFNRPDQNIPKLPTEVVQTYRLFVGPDPALMPMYAGVTIDEVMAEVGMKMSLGDAVLAAQIKEDASHDLPDLVEREALRQETAGPGVGPRRLARRPPEFESMKRLALLVVLTSVGPAVAADPPAFTREQVAFFEKEVKPILQKNCLKCHGAEE